MVQHQETKESILDVLAAILEIQEIDMQMIQLMKLKKERELELGNINAIKDDLMHQKKSKESEILDLKASIRIGEGDLKEIQERITKLEQQQSSIKKVEEFNALSQEMAQADRERNHKNQELSNLFDQLAQEEDALTTIVESFDSTTENSRVLVNEIIERLKKINEEGKQLVIQREKLVGKANPEVFTVYERLLKNKKDRVVVPIESRCCSGCHITLTAQDENLVRKAERIIFCEHCSRILYWVQSEELEGTKAAPTRQRRRRRSTSS